jgi:hypothetical protein
MRFTRYYKEHDANLSFELNLLLSVFRSLKSAYREGGFLEDYAIHYGKKEYEVPASVYANTKAQAIEIGLLKQSKNGACRLDTKGYQKVGTYFGCEADAVRKMRADARKESQKAFNQIFARQ